MKKWVCAVLLAAVAVMAFSVTGAAQAQSLSEGCERLDNGDFDTIGETVALSFGSLNYFEGELIVISTLQLENPATRFTARFEGVNNAFDTTIEADLPGQVQFTVPQSTGVFVTVRPVVVDENFAPIGIIFTCVPAPVDQAEAEGYIQFNHNDQISVTASERPRLTVQFGNRSQEPLLNAEITCTGGTIDRIRRDGPFDQTTFSPAEITFGPGITIRPGQNYNISFSVVPGGEDNIYECVLTGDNLRGSAVRDSVVVLIR